jgi:hypothetical protein
LYAEGVFDDPGPEVAVVKPEGSAWIDSGTLAETSFDWRKVDVASFR